jgi:hypothetical protein
MDEKHVVLMKKAFYKLHEQSPKSMVLNYSEFIVNCIDIKDLL